MGCAENGTRGLDCNLGSIPRLETSNGSNPTSRGTQIAIKISENADPRNFNIFTSPDHLLWLPVDGSLFASTKQSEPLLTPGTLIK